jgi:hypothetical protein
MARAWYGLHLAIRGLAGAPQRRPAALRQRSGGRSTRGEAGLRQQELRHVLLLLWHVGRASGTGRRCHGRTLSRACEAEAKAVWVSYGSCLA